MIKQVNILIVLILELFFRLIILSGDTVAFGGRIIRDGQLAKYINSPETEFYKKGSIIFNLR